MTSYADIDTFKATVGVDDTHDDASIQRALDTATDWIEGYTGRVFYQPSQVASARYFDPVTYDRVSIPDAVSVAEVAVDTNFDGSFATVVPSAHWLLYPLDVGQPGIPGGYTEIRLRTVPWFPSGWIADWVFIPGRQVRVSAVWGYPGQGLVPISIVEACVLLANRYFLRPHAPFGLQESAQFGTLASLPSRDPDVIALLGNYMAPSKSWIAV